MARQLKTPKERAAAELEAANRKVVALDRIVDRLNLEHVTKRRERDDAIALRDFLKQHPALKPPKPTSTTTPEENKA